MTAWAFENVTNPWLVRLHADVSLTDLTIVTCPPAQAPAPLDRLLQVTGVRSIDVHRYRVRLNLEYGISRTAAARTGSAFLRGHWGEPSELPDRERPRAFQADRHGPRRVAESLTMAGDDELLRSIFFVDGVEEVVAADGVVLVRLGRFFRWRDREAAVSEAIASVR
ncbi:MAG: hypothetical protein QOE83_735 [Actinomycetota bacterium]|jgi:hypothetical protein|nr:hypothetical protein [Actinomycetota bacterium]